MTKTAMEVVQAARSQRHITGHEIRQRLFPDFFELHGDGISGDDPAIIGGLATFHGQAVTVVTTSRGHTLEKRMRKHFGQPEPTGYRKVLRLAKQAGKFHRPLLLFIDTAGAYPGKNAEENGQGQAIAQVLLEMSHIPAPIISIFYGEGGSGGALALACGDEVWMLENSIYAILSPEGFATILWKNAKKASRAAEMMRLTPQELLKQKIIEGIIPEPANHGQVCQNIDQCLQVEIKKLQSLSVSDLLARRHQRFRKF